MKGLLLSLLLAPAAYGQAEMPRALYKAGRYAEAAELFRKEAAGRPQDPSTHYNLGNALFKAGRLGPAIASYLRAYRLDPRDDDLRFNLDFALRRAGGTFYPAGIPKIAYNLFHALTLRELEGLQWVLFWIAALLGCVCILAERRREDLLPALAAACALWAGAGGWWAVRWTSEPARLAVTVAPQTELRNGPGEGFSVGFTAPEGRPVEVLQQRDGWIEIGVLKEGVKGWVDEDSLERV